jgi:hypothetical protein
MSPYANTKGSRVRMLGIPLKANVFATLRPRALSAPCTDNPTKKFPGNQGIVSIWRLLFDVDLGHWREELQDEYKYQDSGCDLLIIDCMADPSEIFEDEAVASSGRTGHS